jgi:putative membrane protein
VKLLVWIVVNAVALAAAAWLLEGIAVRGPSAEDRLVTLVVVALIFGVVNAVVAPLVKLLSLPFIILSLGLFLVVVNALMLMLTSWISGRLGLGFAVDGFWTAVVGALVVTLATWVLEAVLPGRG